MRLAVCMCVKRAHVCFIAVACVARGVKIRTKEAKMCWYECFYRV